MLKVIKDSSITILSYNNAAGYLKITKNYLYVALSKGLVVNEYKLEKC